MPAPIPSTLTAALLALTTSGNTLGVGDVATATLAPGVTGSFQFTRDGFPITGATGSGGSATYIASSLDADKRINVLVGNLSFSAGLTALRDTAALLSFYGTSTAGSTLSAALAGGVTGTVAIKRSNGTVAATVSGAVSTSYVLTGGDLALLPFTAAASGLVLTAPISTTVGAAASTPFLTTQAFLYGSTVAANDVFNVRLADGVFGAINFASNGSLVTGNTNLVPGGSYTATSGDAGHQISAVVSALTFTTGGVYGTPVLQSATAAPLLYSLDILDAQHSRIRLGYLALNNLDTASVPAAGQFALSGTVKTAKTITGVTIDNSDPEVKYVHVAVSSAFQPGDAPTLQYTGTSIRYPGGAAAAAFNLPVFSNIPPAAVPMYAGTGQYQRATSPSAGVFQFSANDQWVADAMLTPDTDYGQRAGTTQDCTIQMSILADWGSDTGLLRCVGLNAFPPSYGTWYWEQYSLHRTGNTVALWERGSAGSNAATGAAYTFASPGPLCLAQLRRRTDDQLVHLETSEDGGDTWTQRTVGVAPALDKYFPTAYASRTSAPVTGVGTTGFATP